MNCLPFSILLIVSLLLTFTFPSTTAQVSQAPSAGTLGCNDKCEKRAACLPLSTQTRQSALAIAT
ncbi:hypothetical protein M8C21_027969 [Ambrosia artemisiifolia]|uniref:Apple domain-containing protein n=1 Tax=Ambrosia artemisiifolia TaxID=4212 RepID=A0AAD5CPG7_AMBAR|nr:hypothetical protein M8C21_027969 [Ambrosia artemisiifolia]